MAAGATIERAHQPGAQAAPPGRAPAGLRVAWLLSAAVVVLMAVAGAGGLFIDGLYQDPAWASATYRGGDLVTLVVAAPLLAAALAGAIRGSVRARLVWFGLLAYAAYNTAYYVFGAAFNKLFLVHAALLASSVFALIFGLAGAGASGLARRAGTWSAARPVGAFLVLVAAVLGGMWTAASLRFALTGELPTGGIPVAGLHLVYALDLALLAPSLLVAGVLVWRRTAWGYVAGTAMSVMGAVYQLNLLVATYFSAAAGVPGVAAFSPAAFGLTLAFTAAALALLRRPAWTGTRGSRT